MSSTITPTTASPAINTSEPVVFMELEYTEDVQMEDVFPVYMELEYTDDCEMEDVFPVDMEIDDVDMVDATMDELLSMFYCLTLS